MKTEVKAEILHITPDTAAMWLSDKWPEQRPLKKSHVRRLANDMEKGEFKLSPDAIVKVKGRLANGQHRLEAVIASGQPQPFLVMSCDDEELYKVIDSGMRRTASDGLIELQHSKNLPSIARWVMAYEQQDEVAAARTPADVNSNSARYISQSQLIDYCRFNSEILIEAAKFVAPLYKETRLLPISVGAALYVLAGTRNKKGQIKSFLTKVYVDGGSDAAGDLRNRLISNRGAKTKFTSGFMFGLSIKAFKAFAEGKRPGLLRWSSDEGIVSI